MDSIPPGALVCLVSIRAARVSGDPAGQDVAVDYVVSIRAARVSGDDMLQRSIRELCGFNPRRSGERRFSPFVNTISSTKFQSAPLG